MRRFWLSQARLPQGWADRVEIRVDAAGIIRQLTPNARPAADAVQLHGPVLPGMPNLHSHAFQRAMAGLAECAGPGDDSFWTWRETMYRFALRLGPEDVQAIAAQLYAEMLQQGYTAVAEFHYVHHQPDGSRYDDPAELSWRVLAAAETTGIGLTHLPVLYAHGGFGPQPAGERQRRFLHDAKGYAALLEKLRPAFRTGSSPLRRLGIAPHSLRAVSGPLLAEALALTGADWPVHIHIAEQTAEVDDCQAHNAQRPVQWLLDHAPVDRHWCLVHATHMDAAETTALARSGAVAGLCPTTEANLGDGLFPAIDYLAQGGQFGIGSDSHISIDWREELRLLEYGQRLARRGRNLLAQGPGGSTGQRLFDAALAGGAQALNQPMGAIAIGRRADLVLLDGAAPLLAGHGPETLLDALIFSGQPNPVRAVYVGGRQVVAEGRHVQAENIAAAYRAAMSRLLND